LSIDDSNLLDMPTTGITKHEILGITLLNVQPMMLSKEIKALKKYKKKREQRKLPGKTLAKIEMPSQTTMPGFEDRDLFVIEQNLTDIQLYFIPAVSRIG
jgi:hypothetical protein